jgi:sec-independent protein translocase protein TatA
MLAPMGALGAPELLIILVIILLVFGGAKLPKLAKSLGQAQKEFRKGTTEAEAADEEAGDTSKGRPTA